MPLQIIRQDITKMQVDAIVNPTNEKMIGYSGVDLAVHTAAGCALDEACRELVPLPLGEVRVTAGYGLPAEQIIHVRGPVWQGGDLGEREALKDAYLLSLCKAAELGCASLALPLISTGAYGFPKDEALPLTLEVLSAFLFEHEMTVFLCVYDEDSCALSQKLFGAIESFIDECLDEVYGISCSTSYSSASPEVRRPSVRSIFCEEALPSRAGRSLEEELWRLDKSFKKMLFDLIDESGMTDVECYKRANVDKRVFSKIKSIRDYRPSKQTALAFAIALRLDVEKTQALLATLGMTLSKSIKFDVIVLYFIQNKVYDIFKINEVLFHYDQMLLGSV